MKYLLSEFYIRISKQLAEMGMVGEKDKAGGENWDKTKSVTKDYVKEIAAVARTYCDILWEEKKLWEKNDIVKREKYFETRKILWDVKQYCDTRKILKDIRTE